MSQPISDYIDIQITRDTIQVTRTGFGVPLIFSAEATFSDVRSFATITEVRDEFGSNSETAKQAERLFDQKFKVPIVQIARWNTVNDLTDELDDLIQKENGNSWYSLELAYINLDDTDILDAAAWVSGQKKIFGYQSRTEDILTASTSDIASSLKTLNNERTFGFYTSAGKKQILTLTLDADFVTANVIDGTIDGIAITPVPFTTNHDDTMTALAVELATNAKIETAIVSAPRVITITCLNEFPTINIDMQNFIITLGATQAGVIIIETQRGRGDTINNELHAAILGRIMPLDAGSATWKFKNLNNVAPDELTTTEKNNALGKNINLYLETGPLANTREGTMASGEFIDVIRGVDKIEFGISETIFTTLIELDKVGYTNDGVNVLVNDVIKELQIATDETILSEERPFIVIADTVESVPSSQRASRVAPDINFTAFLAGAIHKVVIRGVISV